MEAKKVRTVQDKKVLIREMMLQGISYDAIAVKLKTSKATIVKEKKKMLAEASGSLPARRGPSVPRSETALANCTDVPADALDKKRKSVELLALSRLERELENEDCDVRVAKDALSVVGSRPKDAPESVTVILNQVYQFAALARERYWSEIEGKPSPQVIDVAAAPSDGPGELAAPEATQHPQADNPCDQAVEVTATQNNDIPADDFS